MKYRIVALLFVLVSMVDCGRILIAAPFGSRSHQNVYIPLIKSLALRGHFITLITNYHVQELEPMSNIEQIEVEIKIDPAMFGDAFKNAIGKGSSAWNAIGTIKGMLDLPVKVAETMYTDQRILQLLKSGKFDMVIVSQFFGFTAYPMAWHFNATLALYSPVSICLQV